jgi:glycosyltransferase involved in cell wall biosynthesis
MSVDKKHTLCLNMIVKDEAHIIENTLTKLLNKVKIDYWVISDTGSTDNTKEIIVDFFKQKNILSFY